MAHTSRISLPYQQNRDEGGQEDCHDGSNFRRGEASAHRKGRPLLDNHGESDDFLSDKQYYPHSSMGLAFINACSVEIATWKDCTDKYYIGQLGMRRDAGGHGRCY